MVSLMVDMLYIISDRRFCLQVTCNVKFEPKNQNSVVYMFYVLYRLKTMEGFYFIYFFYVKCPLSCYCIQLGIYSGVLCSGLGLIKDIQYCAVTLACGPLPVARYPQKSLPKGVCACVCIYNMHRAGENKSYKLQISNNYCL